MTGGKWTTYRKMSQDIIDKASLVGGLEERECITANMPLHGYVKNFDRKDHLHVYGGDRLAINQLVESDKSLGEKLDPDYKYIKAEVVWAVREEMARKLEDFLARRIRILFLDARASLRMAPAVAEIMAAELGKDENWVRTELAEYEALARHYILT